MNERSPKRFDWVVLVLLAMAFVVKLVVLLQLQSHPLLQPEGSPDSAAYVGLAQRVIGGDFTLGPGLYYVSPLYIYFLALTLWIGGGSLTLVRVVQIALGTVAVALVFTMARDWWGRRAGWIAASLATLTGVVTFYEIVILQSALDTFLTAAALFMLDRGLARDACGVNGRVSEDRSTGHPSGTDTSRAVVLSGLWFGLLILNRPNSLVAVAGIGLVLVVIRRTRAAAVLIAGACVALAPVVLRNLIVSRQFALVSSQGGLNFYIGNNASATGQYQAVPGVRADIEGQSNDTRRVAEQALGHALTDAQVSSYFTGRAVAWMRQHPLSAARLFAKKLALVLNVQHQWLDFSYPYYAYDTGSILGWMFVGPWLLVPLGLTGLIAFGVLRTAAYATWMSFVPFYAVSVAVFFVAERYRLPLFVPLCVGAGGAADRLLMLRTRDSAGPSRRAVVASVVIFVAAAIVAFLPFRIDDGRYAERLRLSKALMNTHDYAGAVRELETAAALRPADTATEFNLGMALLAEGRALEGIGHVRHAVDAGVPIKGARYALANALLMTGDRDGTAALIRTFSPTPSDSAESCYHVAVLALNVNDTNTARRYLRRALELKPDYREAAELLRQLART